MSHTDLIRKCYMRQALRYLIMFVTMSMIIKTVACHLSPEVVFIISSSAAVTFAIIDIVSPSAIFNISSKNKNIDEKTV